MAERVSRLVNRNGLRFIVQEYNTQRIYITYDWKTITVECNYDEFLRSWLCWIEGEYIQTAFDYLSAGEREFLLTGIVAKEWEAIFPNGDDE